MLIQKNQFGTSQGVGEGAKRFLLRRRKKPPGQKRGGETGSEVAQGFSFFFSLGLKKEDTCNSLTSSQILVPSLRLVFSMRWLQHQFARHALCDITKGFFYIPAEGDFASCGTSKDRNQGFFFHGSVFSDSSHSYYILFQTGCIYGFRSIVSVLSPATSSGVSSPLLWS